MKTGLILLLCGAGTALAQLSGNGVSAGTFTATEAMATARFDHTATLLNNGQVLIAGGAPTFRSPTASAELYNPTSGTFTPTGNMTMPRSRHTATLLPDCRVLIGGGYTVCSDNLLEMLNTAEIYDPSTGTFTPTGDMIHGHECAKANLLNNGKVLLSGGAFASDYHVPNADLYDPTTASFADAGPYATNSNGFNTCAASNSLPDGRVLILWDDDAVEIYDPATGLFTYAGKPAMLSFSWGMPTTTLLMNGKVLVAGGADGSGTHSLAELFDVSTGAFSSVESMSTGHASHSATLLPNGSVLIAGGGPLYDHIGTLVASVAPTEIYNPLPATFSAGPDMITFRSNHTSTLLNDGRVLFAGGSILGAGATALAELYTPDVLTPAPVLLSLSGSGQGQGAVLHGGTARLVTAQDPAVAGEVLEIYCTGLMDGGVIPPQGAIGGRLAPILYFGQAPGFRTLNQVNIRVPAGAVAGAAVRVRLTYLGRPTNAVTIGIQ